MDFRLARQLSGYASFALLILISLLVIRAPLRVPRCHTDDRMRQILGNDYARWLLDYRAHLRELQAPHRHPTTADSSTRYVIPVVVHIIHDDGPSNISNEQVEDGIRLLNEIYQARHPDTAQVIPYFRPRVGNVNLEFRLARLDPHGHCTNGINRHYSLLTNTARDDVKRLPGARWPTHRYVNIWVVQSISGGASGYAYFPCMPSSRDGLVVRNSYFGSIGTAPNVQSHRYTLAHEMGHFLGLCHTSGHTNAVGPGLGNCSDDDGIEDTPSTEGTLRGTCDLLQPACPGSSDLFSNVQNIMDYSASCRCMFTRGQARLMRETLTGGFACRAELITPSNLALTGVADDLDLPPCTPVAYLTVVGGTPGQLSQRVCAGDSVRFRGEAYNIGHDTTLTYRWRFPGGQPATSSAPDPVVHYATPGTYDVFLQVTNAAGTDSMIRADYVQVRSTTGATLGPVVESFEDPAFPRFTSDSLRVWEISQPPAGPTWEYTRTAAAEGTGSVRLRLRQTVKGTAYDLISPNLVVGTTLHAPTLYFRNAYAPASAASDDLLTISYSFDCGRTWITPGRTAQRTARVLQTAPPHPKKPFVPTSRQWRQDSLLLQTQPLHAATHLLIRFRVTSKKGSALYLDDIRLEGREVGFP